MLWIRQEFSIKQSAYHLSRYNQWDLTVHPGPSTALRTKCLHERLNFKRHHFNTEVKKSFDTTTWAVIARGQLLLVSACCHWNQSSWLLQFIWAFLLITVFLMKNNSLSLGWQDKQSCFVHQLVVFGGKQWLRSKSHRQMSVSKIGSWKIKNLPWQNRATCSKTHFSDNLNYRFSYRLMSNNPAFNPLYFLCCWLNQSACCQISGLVRRIPNLL